MTAFKPQPLANDSTMPFRRLTLCSAVMTALLAGGYGRSAYGGSCQGSVSVVFCGEAADSKNDVTVKVSPESGDLTVTTISGFGITTAESAAFLLATSSGGLTFTDEYKSVITGASDGIYADVGAGAVSITTTGSVIGQDGSGIDISGVG